jgi:endonuclease/exonuclease/phosphatase family metal-dependent hydrolase
MIQVSFRYGISVILLIIWSACQQQQNSLYTPNFSNVSNSSNISNPKTRTIKICTFNIQNLGKTKMKKHNVVTKLVSIIRKYDIVAVQEISDAGKTTGQKLLDIINKGYTIKYNMLLSPRTGQQQANKNYREQYAFYYNSAVIKDLGSSRLFNDYLHDYFKREPFLAHFMTKEGNFSFVLCTIHTDPDNALQEINALDYVIKWASPIFQKEDDYILLGDFNASCGYATPLQLNQSVIRKKYIWLIADSVNTNLASQVCAYDRILTTPVTKTKYTGSWGVDRCFTDSSISDHWPVWAEFYVKENK